MNREQRFVSLVQMMLNWYLHQDAYPDGSGLIARPDLDLFMQCLDEAYDWITHQSKRVMGLELDKLAKSYVNNWLANNPGWRKDADGGR